MERDAKTVPVGETILVKHTEDIIIRFTRVSERNGVIEHCEPVDGCSVLVIELDVYGESPCDIKYVDYAYWTITVNGRPITPGEALEGTFNVNDEDRTIELVNVENDYVC